MELTSEAQSFLMALTSKYLRDGDVLFRDHIVHHFQSSRINCWALHGVTKPIPTGFMASRTQKGFFLLDRVMSVGINQSFWYQAVEKGSVKLLERPFAELRIPIYLQVP